MIKSTFSSTPCGMVSILRSAMVRLQTSPSFLTSQSPNRSISQTNLSGSTQMSSPTILNEDWALRCRSTSTISTSLEEKAFIISSLKSSSAPFSLSSSSNRSTFSISPFSSRRSTFLWVLLIRGSLLRMDSLLIRLITSLEHSARSSSYSQSFRNGSSTSSRLSRSCHGTNGPLLTSLFPSWTLFALTTFRKVLLILFSQEWGSSDWISMSLELLWDAGLDSSLSSWLSNLSRSS